jgi:hypothetical protein
MKDYIKKWWNREWGKWQLHYESEWVNYIVLVRVSNDGLMEFKKINTR